MNLERWRLLWDGGKKKTRGLKASNMWHLLRKAIWIGDGDSQRERSHVPYGEELDGWDHLWQMIPLKTSDAHMVGKNLRDLLFEEETWWGALINLDRETQ